MVLTRVLVASALVAGSLLAVTSIAGAASTAKTCKALDDLSEDLGDIDTTFDIDEYDSDVFEQVGKAFKKAAKKAPKQVKSALKTLGNFYADLADADNPVEASVEFSKQARKYARAATTFGTFYATKCTGTSSSGSSSSGRQSGSSAGDGATVVIDGEEHQFPDTQGCTITRRAVSANFENGDDMVSLTSADDVVLVRMTLDGVDWADTGSPPEPDINGDDVTWSGEMGELDGGSEADVTIEFTC